VSAIKGAEDGEGIVFRVQEINGKQAEGKITLPLLIIASAREANAVEAPGKDLVTLHIYSPPISKMNTYDFAAPISAECASKYRAAGEHPC